MSLNQVSLFFALLALGANIFALGVASVLLGARVSARLEPLDLRIRDSLDPNPLPLAFLVAAVATLGSLYLSEIAHLVPCRLCWYQRIAMYPLAVLFGVAWWRRAKDVWWYGLPIATVGALISTYHYVVQWQPSLESGSCSATVPCSAVYLRKLGFMSIPYMALSGFLAIIALCLFMREVPNQRDIGETRDGADEVAKAASNT